MKKTLTVKEIIEQVIKQVGGDGLYKKDWGGCYCILGDLGSCDCLSENCEIAKNNPVLADEQCSSFWLEPIDLGDQTISVTLRKRCEDKNEDDNS